MRPRAIEYREGNGLDLEHMIALYAASTLGERRPIRDRAAMSHMLKHANLVITAWAGDDLIGIARTLTDFAYMAYVADLAVHADWQHRGIGTELLRETRKRLGPNAYVTLLAAPAARSYYPKIGFQQHDSAWLLPAGAPLRKVDHS